MIKRNIAIFILILIIVIAFAATIIIFIFGKKDIENSPAQPDGVKATIKISDVIDEAVYMGAFSSETPIFADEPFSAKETLRSALAKSNGVPDAALIKIDDFNIDDLSIFFDDGRTMRTLSQSGNTNVMIVAAVSQHNKDVYYAYNVEISVGESKTPRETVTQVAETDISGSSLTLMTTTTTAITTTEKSWNWNNSWNSTTTTKKAYVTTSKPKNPSWVTTTKATVTTEDKENENVTTAPSVTEPSAPPETDPPTSPETDPPAPPETDPPAPPETDPPAPPETDPPAPPETDPPAPPETDPPAPPETDPPAPPQNEEQPAG